MITFGTCLVDGRKVVVTAGDFTVRGGSGDGQHGGLGEKRRQPAQLVRAEHEAMGMELEACVLLSHEARRGETSDQRAEPPRVLERCLPGVGGAGEGVLRQEAVVGRAVELAGGRLRGVAVSPSSRAGMGLRRAKSP